MDRFWREVAPRCDELVKLAERAQRRIPQVLAEFKRHLPGFRPATDFYLTISFSFQGKVLDVGGRRVLALGLESFKSDLQLSITVAHELFHLFHFETFSAKGGLYRSLWAEGLAVYASAVVVPGYRRSAYLGFDVKKMNRCHELLPRLAADLRRHLGDSRHGRKRLYFGAEDNDTWIPPEAGYYVGLLIAEAVAKRVPLARLARLDKDQVYRLLDAELRKLI
jgi:uncharacterized protein YjaZ